MGTGGTISGTARYPEGKKPATSTIVGVDILGSLLYETWKLGKIRQATRTPKPYKIEGIGEGFSPHYVGPYP